MTKSTMTTAHNDHGRRAHAKWTWLPRRKASVQWMGRSVSQVARIRLTEYCTSGAHKKALHLNDKLSVLGQPQPTLHAGAENHPAHRHCNCWWQRYTLCTSNICGYMVSYSRLTIHSHPPAPTTLTHIVEECAWRRSGTASAIGSLETCAHYLCMCTQTAIFIARRNIQVCPIIICVTLRNEFQLFFAGSHLTILISFRLEMLNAMLPYYASQVESRTGGQNVMWAMKCSVSIRIFLSLCRYFHSRLRMATVAAMAISPERGHR